MYRLNNIKRNILIVSCVALLAGCGGGGTTGSTDTTSTDTTSTDTTTPTLKVVAIQINEPITTENSVTIEWAPNGYTSKLVEYGTSRKYGSELSVKEEGTITLFNLQSNTTYHYRIVSEDKNGKKVVSRDNTFMTLEQSTQTIVSEPAPTEPIVTEPAPTEPIVTEPAPTEPIVTEPAPTEPIVTEPAPIPLTIKSIENVSTTENSTVINWELSNYATGQIEYGITNNYGNFSTKEESFMYNKHIQTLSNLESDTTYHYRVISADENGNNVISEDQTFKTLPAPTEPIVTEPTPEPQVSACQSGPAQQLGQIKDSISDVGLVDVTVTIAGCSTKTDVNGFYTLNNIVLNDKAVVNFEKDGYLLGSTKIQIKTLSGDNTPSTNYLEYAIDTYDTEWSFDSQTNASGAHIDIPASVYTDTAGDPYSGVVSAVLEIQDITTNLGKSIFPGSFEGQNTNGEIQQFVSHGLISLSFKDINGNPLNFSEGTIATLTFDAVSSMDGTNIIPLWYYDYLQGLWIEEGYAELQTDGTYIGDISHSGTWSLNQPIENAPGIYTGSILNTDGLPISDVRLHAIGNNWISSDLSTDENGLFEIAVIPGSSFQLTAYNYKDKYGAMYDVTISAIASGDIVGN